MAKDDGSVGCEAIVAFIFSPFVKSSGSKFTLTTLAVNPHDGVVPPAEAEYNNPTKYNPSEAGYCVVNEAEFILFAPCAQTVALFDEDATNDIVPFNVVYNPTPL